MKYTSLISPRINEKLPETNYASTYKAIQDPRPRSSKRPPLSARDSHPLSMLFETHQRSDFKPYGEIERRKPIFKEEHYEPPTKPFTGTTSYRKEFIPKKGSPVAPVPLPNNEATMKLVGKFINTTTAKDHYKPWQPQTTIPFRELPSSVESIIFPDKQPLPESTTKNSYPGKVAPRTQPCKMVETYTHPQGKMDMSTTHRSMFKLYSGEHRTTKIERKPQIKLATPTKFDSTTQFQQDYPGYSNRQPSRAKLIAPPRTSVKLSFDNRQSFETEQRSIFKGHDTRQNPMRQSYKKEPEKYVQPTVKVETLSSQKRDYRPINVDSLSNPRSSIIVPKPNLKLAGNSGGVFDSRTSNKEFFQEWNTKPRIRYGDPQEVKEYIPPQEKFHTETTTRTTYTPKTYEGVTSFKPMNELSMKQKQHEQEMTTSYRTTFKKPKVKMCRAQIFLIQQQLKKQHQQKFASQLNKLVISQPFKGHLQEA